MKITKEWIEKARKDVRWLIDHYKECAKKFSFPETTDSCPLCRDFRKTGHNCQQCPWLIFEDIDCHEGLEVTTNERLARLNRWLRMLDLLEGTLMGCPDDKLENPTYYVYIRPESFEQILEKLTVSSEMAVRLYRAGVRPPEPESDMEKPYWIIDRETAEKVCWCGKKDCLDNKKDKFFFGFVNEFDPPWEKKYARYRAFTIPELEPLVGKYYLGVDTHHGDIELTLFDEDGQMIHEQGSAVAFTGTHLPDLYGEAVLWRLKNGGVK